MRNTTGFCSCLVMAVGTSLEVWRETQCPFPVAIGILGFLEIFKRCQASSPFEALNSAFLSSCKRYWRPPVELRRNYGFSTDSTGDLHIHSSCEIIDEPAFNSLQGNPALFRLRASRCPLHSRQQNEGPSHKLIAERSLFLTRLW